MYCGLDKETMTPVSVRVYPGELYPIEPVLKGHPGLLQPIQVCFSAQRTYVVMEPVKVSQLYSRNSVLVLHFWWFRKPWHNLLRGM